MQDPGRSRIESEIFIKYTETLYIPALIHKRRNSKQKWDTIY